MNKLIQSRLVPHCAVVSWNVLMPFVGLFLVRLGRNFPSARLKQ